MVSSDVVCNALSDFFDANGIREWEDLCYGDEFRYDNFNGEIRDGATKVVLMPWGADFVIKIPFFGERDGWDRTAIPFCCALNNDLGVEGPNDYCALEAAAYKKAVEWGIEDMFASTYQFGHYYNIPIYIQTRVSPLRRKANDDSTYKYASLKGSETFDSEVGANLMDFYDASHVERFLQFYNRFCLNDMANFRNGGFDRNSGRYIFWDYSGYNDG